MIPVKLKDPLHPLVVAAKAVVRDAKSMAPTGVSYVKVVEELDQALRDMGIEVYGALAESMRRSEP